MVTIDLPFLLRNHCKITENVIKIHLPSNVLTIKDTMLSFVRKKCPEMASFFFENIEGNLSEFISFYVNGENINNLQKEQTLIMDGDSITIISPIAGG
ncbi:unnamed protein product [marine sediment metagenome]|uniref:Ubiquitin-like domain-containing protein n=1 Tax=marine sediment metagenome TaxID=412755 RepID=X0VH51_9ZZZZ